MSDNRPVWLALAAGGGFVLVIAVGVYNVELFQAINGGHGPLLDGFFGLVSGLGDGLIVALALTALLLFRLRAGLAGLLAFGLSGLLAQMLKRLFDMPRPPVVLDNVHVLGHTLSAHSFPSGHATSAGVLAMLLPLLFDRRDARVWLAVALLLLAAVGRVYGGVHFPLDVLVGLALGAMCMAGMWRWVNALPRQAWETSSWARSIPTLAVAVEAAVLGLGYQVQPVTAQPMALALPLAALAWVAWIWRDRAGD
ncbi:MAG: phosphatase PAP2 family protein [Mariprofundaceae bacterium]